MYCGKVESLRCWESLTEVPEVVGAEGHRNSRRIGNPIPLDKECAKDEECTGNVDIVNVVAREPRVLDVGSHFRPKLLFVLVSATGKEK